MHKSQVFGYLLISFLVGVFIGPWFDSVTLATLILILVGTIVLVVSGYERTFAKTKRAERNRQVGMIVGACILVLSLGVFRYGQVNFGQSILSQFSERTAGPAVGGVNKGIKVVLRGYVDNSMEVNGSQGQVYLHVRELEVPGNVIKVDERTLLFTNTFPIYKVGDKI